MPVLEGNLVERLSPERTQAVRRAAQAVTESGWLRKRPVTVSASEPQLATLIARRNGNPSPARRSDAPPAPEALKPRDSLLSVARDEGWFKVDTQPQSYR